MIWDDDVDWVGDDLMQRQSEEDVMMKMAMMS